ncbi:MAG: hypothetical protein ACLQIH_06400 [Myxococcaceae bacterium]
MDNFLKLGRPLFGVALIAFGADDLMCAHFGLAVSGVPWFPASPPWGYLTGLVFIASGLSIAVGFRARLSAMVLGVLFLLYALLEAPEVIADPLSVGTRTVFFEALALSASALMLAGTLQNKGEGLSKFDKLIDLGPYVFGVSSIVFGIDHFLVIGFIASLVPGWLPGHLFWAFLTGIAFVAAGIAIVAKRMDRWAAFLLGVMFGTWFIVLHSPRVVHALMSYDPSAPDEWSSAFIALGLCAGSWICACYSQQRRGRTVERQWLGTDVEARP